MALQNFLALHRTGFSKSLVKQHKAHGPPPGSDMRLMSPLTLIGSLELLLTGSTSSKKLDCSDLNMIESRLF